MTRLVLVSIVLLCISIGHTYAQKIVGDSLLIRIEQEIIPDSVPLMIAKMHIDAYFTIDTQDKDAISFKNTVILPAKEFVAQNIEASVIENSSLTPLQVDFTLSMPEQEILVDVSGYKNLHLKLSYDILGSLWFLFFSIPDEIGYIPSFAYHAMQENLYPEFGECAEFKTIRVTNSLDGFKLYPSKEVLGKVTKPSKLNMTLIRESHYKSRSFDYGLLKLNVHYVDSTLYARHTSLSDKLTHAMEKLSKLPIPKDNSVVDVITAYWTNEKMRLAYGALFHSEYILCDISFISKSEEGLLHEIMHKLFPINVEDNTPARFFLTESINEWLTEVAYNDRYQAESFELSEGQIETSLYDLRVNDSFSNRYVYGYGPFILQKFADAEGVEKTFKAVADFLILNREQAFTLSDFLSYLESHNFTLESIGNLTDDIKKPLKQKVNYYPFSIAHGTLNNLHLNKYLYGGKEYQDGMF